MPLTFVSSVKQTQNFTGQASKSVTAGNNLFVVTVVSLGNDIAATGITDNQGNTWTRDAHGNDANRHLAIFRSIAGSTGTLDIQVVVSGTLDACYFQLAEFSGALAASPFDGASTVASGAGTTVTGNSYTPSQADCFLVGLGAVDFTGTQFTPNSPWVDRTNTLGERAHFASREVSAIASYSLTGTLNASESWGAIFAAYKFPSVGGGGALPFRTTIGARRVA